MEKKNSIRVSEQEIYVLLKMLTLECHCKMDRLGMREVEEKIGNFDTVTQKWLHESLLSKLIDRETNNLRHPNQLGKKEAIAVLSPDRLDLMVEKIGFEDFRHFRDCLEGIKVSYDQSDYVEKPMMVVANDGFDPKGLVGLSEWLSAKASGYGWQKVSMDDVDNYMLSLEEIMDGIALGIVIIDKIGLQKLGKQGLLGLLSWAAATEDRVRVYCHDIRKEINKMQDGPERTYEVLDRGQLMQWVVWTETIEERKRKEKNQSAPPQETGGGNIYNYFNKKLKKPPVIIGKIKARTITLFGNIHSTIGEDDEYEA